MEKKIDIWSFQILPTTAHQVISFPFVYISHNNTYILVVPVALICDHFLCFILKWIVWKCSQDLYYFVVR